MVKCQNTSARDVYMDIEIVEEKIDKLFADAIDVKDTIWYTETETLRDAIIRIIDDEISLNAYD